MTIALVPVLGFPTLRVFFTFGVFCPLDIYYSSWLYFLPEPESITIRPLYFCEECGVELPRAEDDEKPRFYPWCSELCAVNAFVTHMIF